MRPTTDEIKISILMSIYDTDPHHLIEAIESVKRQTYWNWELCICNNCSTKSETRSALRKYQGRDVRIKITRSPALLHIASATNLAAEFATGDFIGFLDHDDTLAPDTIERVVEAATNYPKVDLFYTDEDKIAADNSYVEPHYKPEWSPEHLPSAMYLLHFLVIRKKLFLSLGCLCEKVSETPDYDLALRASQVALEIAHIPKVLYHRRKGSGETAAVAAAEPQALV